MSGVIDHVKHVIRHPLEPITHPVKALKGEWRTAKNFTKNNWKKILIAAAIVFTAGIATVGVAGFAASSAAAGGGFAGFMSAAGSTFVAGAGAIGATVGIGSGASGAAAAGSAAGAAGAAGAGGAAAATTGATVGAATGATAAGAAGAAGAGITTLAPVVTTATVPALAAPALTVGDAALAAGGGLMAANAVSGAPTAQSAGQPQKYNATGNSELPEINIQPTQPTVGAPTGQLSTSPLNMPTSPMTANVTATPAPESGFFGGLGDTMGNLMNSKAAGPLIYGGMQALRGAARGQAIQDQLDATKPLGYWGVGVRGNAEDANVSSPFGADDALNDAAGQGAAGLNGLPNGTARPRVFRAGANLPSGSRWMPQVPNGNNGLMALAWNINTGQPYNPNDPTDPNNPRNRYQ